MNVRIPLAVALISTAAGLAGCVCKTDETSADQKAPTGTNMAFKPLGAQDYWAMRESEDRAAVAKEQSEQARR